jgi:predicted PhzF superfamily epimerase YddE/YHI9
MMNVSETTFVLPAERPDTESRQRHGVQPHVRASVGVPEDPATGGACGPLGSYLVKNKVVTVDRAGAMLNVQGLKMGRPSCIHIAIRLDGSGITSGRVGGEWVLAGAGTLYV